MNHNPQRARNDDPEVDPALYTDLDHVYDDDVYDDDPSAASADGYVGYAMRNTPLAFPDEHMAQLALTLGFGPDDLAANQEGILTESQIARLESNLRWFYWPMIGALAAIAFLIGATSALAGSFTVVSFVLLALAVIPALLLKRERERLPDREVLVTMLRVGRFSLTMRRWGIFDDDEMFGTVKYPVSAVGGKSIWGPKHLYKGMQPNRLYLLYYAPVRTWRGYRLLSIEPAEAEKSKVKSPPKRKGKHGEGSW